MLTKWRDPPIGDESVERLWEEYSYRHGHVWRVVFQTTAAVVALSILPYLPSADRAGYLTLVSLFIAIGLAYFALARITREFEALDVVKNEYLARTREPPGPAESKFRGHTVLYLHGLFWGAVAHSIVLIAAVFSVEWRTLLHLSLAL